VIIPEPRPISSRFLTQDDRIAIADGLAAGVPVKEIAAGIGKSFQTVYREIARALSLMAAISRGGRTTRRCYVDSARRRSGSSPAAGSGRRSLTSSG